MGQGEYIKDGGLIEKGSTYMIALIDTNKYGNKRPMVIKN